MASTDCDASGPAIADIAPVPADLGGTGGGGAVAYYQMRGWGTVSEAYVGWVVSGSADFAAAEAPEVVSDVVLISTWQV